MKLIGKNLSICTNAYNFNFLSAAFKVMVKAIKAIMVIVEAIKVMVKAMIKVIVKPIISQLPLD